MISLQKMSLFNLPPKNANTFSLTYDINRHRATTFIILVIETKEVLRILCATFSFWCEPNIFACNYKD